MMYKKNPQSGFSLVETLVSITILLIVITGPMAISSNAAKSSSFSAEQVTAFFLAQEGAEIVQKVRDDLIIESFNPPPGTEWADFTDDSLNAVFDWCYEGDGCGVEMNTDAAGTVDDAKDCNGALDCKLYYDSGDERARYTHESAGNASTPYTRVIYMEETVAGVEVKVTSRVYWQTGSQRQVQEVEVVTYLFNVYDRP